MGVWHGGVMRARGPLLPQGALHPQDSTAQAPAPSTVALGDTDFLSLTCF